MFALRGAMWRAAAQSSSYSNVPARMLCTKATEVEAPTTEARIDKLQASVDQVLTLVMTMKTTLEAMAVVGERQARSTKELSKLTDQLNVKVRALDAIRHSLSSLRLP